MDLMHAVAAVAVHTAHHSTSANPVLHERILAEVDAGVERLAAAVAGP